MKIISCKIFLSCKRLSNGKSKHNLYYQKAYAAHLILFKLNMCNYTTPSIQGDFGNIERPGASAKTKWVYFILYMAVVGSYLGLEIDSFIGDLPFLQMDILLLFVNILAVPMLPMVLMLLAGSFYSRQNHCDGGMNGAVAAAGGLYMLLIALLAIYKSVCRIDFDFYFFWYNTEDALPVIRKLFASWIPVILLSGTAIAYIQKRAIVVPARLLRKSPRKTRAVILAVLVCCCACQALTLRRIRGSAVGFVYASFLSDRSLRDVYVNLYSEHIETLKKSVPQPTDRFDPYALGDAVFIVKQESLSGLLTVPEITPQLFRAGRDGILFPKMYGNSIQSLRGYSSILCGVPPSITFALADAYPAVELAKLNCMPRVFRSFGYRALYFFGGSRNPRIVHFAESIGFEEVLADDIMRPEDIKFNWGYREDVFYTRVMEYLKTHFAGEKLFVFIDTGATNHAPFEVLDETFRETVPFPKPKNFTERISNTTFVQDAYFGIFYGMFMDDYRETGTLIAVSDHAWPIPVHKNNIYNERGAYEENFLISLLFVPPSSKAAEFDIGTLVHLRYSQMDIKPTILDLLGIERYELLGESFAPWILTDPGGARSEPQKTKISVQPYGGGFIAIHKYPQKYLFDVLGKNVKVYDLLNDPVEMYPDTRATDQYMPLIRDFFYNYSTPTPYR